MGLLPQHSPVWYLVLLLALWVWYLCAVSMGLLPKTHLSVTPVNTHLSDTCVLLAWVYYPNTHLSDTCALWALLAWVYYPNTHLSDTCDTCVLLAWVYYPNTVWYLCAVSMGLLPKHSPVWYLVLLAWVYYPNTHLSLIAWAVVSRIYQKIKQK